MVLLYFTRVYSQVKFKQMSRTSLKQKKNINIRHAGVLGLCSFINAHPYKIPAEVPPLFSDIGVHLNDPEPISVRNFLRCCLQLASSDVELNRNRNQNNLLVLFWFLIFFFVFMTLLDYPYLYILAFLFSICTALFRWNLAKFIKFSFTIGIISYFATHVEVQICRIMWLTKPKAAKTAAKFL